MEFFRPSHATLYLLYLYIDQVSYPYPISAQYVSSIRIEIKKNVDT
jgi:hypothetical protein